MIALGATRIAFAGQQFSQARATSMPKPGATEKADRSTSNSIVWGNIIRATKLAVNDASKRWMLEVVQLKYGSDFQKNLILHYMRGSDPKKTRRTPAQLVAALSSPCRRRNSACRALQGDPDDKW